MTRQSNQVFSNRTGLFLAIGLVSILLSVQGMGAWAA